MSTASTPSDRLHRLGGDPAKLAADNATSADRWNTVTLATLHGAVIKAAADAPRIDNATALLVLWLTRLI